MCVRACVRAVDIDVDVDVDVDVASRCNLGVARRVLVSRAQVFVRLALTSQFVLWI